MKQFLRRTSFLLTLLLWLGACGGQQETGTVPRGAIPVQVVAHTSLGPWLAQASADFYTAQKEAGIEAPYFVLVQGVEAGQAAVQMSNGNLAADLWIPDEPAWVDVLAGLGTADYQGQCTSIAESPLVIAMWQPIAEALGWPGRDLGWLDVGSLAADPSAWAYYSGGQFGDSLQLGHTHPGLSGTGASTLLAIVQAAERKQEAVTVAEIQRPIVQASVGAFEAAVTWFSPTTTQLGQTMRERGTSYLGAGVMYENVAIRYGQGEPALVPIYPLEGTFVATNPACINGRASAEGQAGAKAFRDYLLTEAGQRTAVSFGLRPVDASLSFNNTALLGLDSAEPVRRFAPATAETLLAVQDVWQAARKPINLVMLLDTSGSMRGARMENMRTAAVTFVEQMGEDDRITIIAFADSPVEVISHLRIGDERERVISVINRLEARGNTTLYDAVGEGGRVIARTNSSSTSNVMVVLSDGADTASVAYRGITPELINLATGNNTTIFTISYGNDADTELMRELATRANGNHYVGDEASIALIYEEMSAAFGGSVGIGR